MGDEIIRITIQGKNVEDAFVVLPNGCKTIHIERIKPGDKNYNQILKGESNNMGTVEKTESTNNFQINESLSSDKNPIIHKSLTPIIEIPITSFTDCILTSARKMKKKNAYIRGLTKSISITYAQFTRGVFKV